MKPCARRGSQTRSRVRDENSNRPGPSLFTRWFMVNSVVAGFLALCWLLLRSGSKPSRLAYPCQQAAMSAAVLAFGAPVVGTLITARRRLTAGLRTPTGLGLTALAVVLAAGLWSYFTRAATYGGPVLDPPPDYRARIFRVTDCPHDPDVERFIGLDNLLVLMGREGLKFYESPTESLISGPEGIIASNDVVVVKINYQWPQRGGTNTDLLRGLIRRILDHPDVFTGEVVVCENTQSEPIQGFDRDQNNAQDIAQSPHDVVTDSAAQGFSVSHYSWTGIRNISVDEYSEGDSADGYVVYPLNPDVNGRVSYPKFQTDLGTYISLRDGVWDPAAETYDRGRLKFINVPVLKSHGASYGATACVKHYMGVVTNLLGTNSHYGIANGILGAQIGVIRPADLNILDCIWVNPDPDDGPWCSYGAAARIDELLASTDPVATDIWATKNILIPAFLADGHSPPWPEPSADPDDPDSDFRNYLDNSMNQILAAGFEVTNDPDQIDVWAWNGAGDTDGDSDVDLADHAAFADCCGGPGLLPTPGCEALDSDADEDIDLTDFASFQNVFTGAYEFPPQPSSRLYVDADAQGANDGSSWENAYTDLQEALDGVAAHWFVNELWIAEGTYTPDRGTGDRGASFELPGGLSLYGGFDGWETDPAQRDWAANPTILSGDLDGDDAPGPGDNAENSHRVVVVAGGSELPVTIDGCVIAGGNANGTFPDNVGGGIYVEGRTVSLQNCWLRANAASLWGGGVFLWGLPEATLVNCAFSGNSAGTGGGLFMDLATNTMVNCTFAGNTADSGGGGIYQGAGTLAVANTMLWGNTDSSGSGEDAQLNHAGGTLAADYSCIQGLTGGLGGTGNIGNDPLYVDPVGPDGVSGTADDDLRLSPGSPCIDAADNAAVPEGVTVDLAGSPRFVDDPATDDTGSGTPPVVDMGAYEFQAN